MKIEKGNPGYIRAQKLRYLWWAFLEFAVVAAVFVLGYVQTGTKNNLFSVAAVVGCMPAAKMLVEFLAMYPHKGIEAAKYREIEDKSPLVLCLYDLLVSSPQKLMAVDAFAISGRVVCGYASSPKTDEVFLAKHIKKELENQRYEKITVKIFHDYKMFLARVEGMNSIAAVEQQEQGRYERNMGEILLHISM